MWSIKSIQAFNNEGLYLENNKISRSPPQNNFLKIRKARTLTLKARSSFNKNILWRWPEIFIIAKAIINFNHSATRMQKALFQMIKLVIKERHNYNIPLTVLSFLGYYSFVCVVKHIKYLCFVNSLHLSQSLPKSV